MKLTKAQAKAMIEVERLVALDRRLTMEEREFVLENYQESAGGNNALAGAFFTPTGLARDFRIEVPSGKTMVDLCAGIGSLAYACEDRAEQIVCVERNAEYIRVGRKVMPDATWVHADVFGDWFKEFGTFDMAIANPPFGAIKADGWNGKYMGGRFEYKVIELASRIARWGTFIVPQQSAPFRFSGRRMYEESIDQQCQKFIDLTGIQMEANCGIDTAFFKNEWHGVAPICEIVLCDFAAIEPVQCSVDAAPQIDGTVVKMAREVRTLEQLDLFAEAA
ncbi:methyltransferase [Burkholderia vietnamiensis]|uniref:methyltransferase n=1 Tax=Burkholderia vietnamiensis TaxID=60552 RepID=UPI0015934838|nr:methyltransferase [Burkholderia vietnamiensis]